MLTGPTLCVVSLMTITAITVDRFLALHYHMRYATLVTESRVKVAEHSFQVPMRNSS